MSGDGIHSEHSVSLSHTQTYTLSLFHTHTQTHALSCVCVCACVCVCVCVHSTMGKRERERVCVCVHSAIREGASNIPEHLSLSPKPSLRPNPSLSPKPPLNMVFLNPALHPTPQTLNPKKCRNTHTHTLEHTHTHTHTLTHTQGPGVVLQQCPVGPFLESDAAGTHRGRRALQKCFAHTAIKKYNAYA
jgi:hypothetical protein